MRRILIYILFLVIFYSINSYGNEFIIGKAKVIDGDTIKINNKKIRLHGIDAPEIKQLCKRVFLTIYIFSFQEKYKCGEISKKRLKKFVGNSAIKCKVEGTDRYKRILGTCYKKKININSKMVKNGHALAYKQYSEKYLYVERQAEKDKLGLWIGKFDYPWEWRKNNK